MIRYENECCDCAVQGYPCKGDLCKNRNVPHLYCDDCKEEQEELYELDGKELCDDCALKRLDKVELWNE